MPVRPSGASSNFTGPGTLNPTKLFIPRKDEMDEPTAVMARTIEQYVNSLNVSPSNPSQSSGASGPWESSGGTPSAVLINTGTDSNSVADANYSVAVGIGAVSPYYGSFVHGGTSSNSTGSVFQHFWTCAGGSFTVSDGVFGLELLEYQTINSNPTGFHIDVVGTAEGGAFYGTFDGMIVPQYYYSVGNNIVFAGGTAPSYNEIISDGSISGISDIQLVINDNTTLLLTYNAPNAFNLTIASHFIQVNRLIIG